MALPRPLPDEALKVVMRDADKQNLQMPTGRVEVIAQRIRILSDARTPPFEIGSEKASEDLRKVVSDPAFKAQLAGRGSYPVPMSPTEVTAFIRDQQQQWSPVLRQLAAQP